MSDVKTLLLDQLLANANDSSWYSAFSDSVDGLSEEEAFWKPDDGSHSIAEIVQHLIYWNDTWQVRYNANHVNAVPATNDNTGTFLIREEITFSALKDKLLTTLLYWQEIIDADQLLKSVTGFPEKAEWWAIISNAATHNAYHIGQIAYIRKIAK
ncbi:DinB family protein [Jeotgalibacillus sp. S-D1]|uniref:DinB family protein n=1 Tax=Jeotgalibacillus sp. S-D1 TaxID=2552189 RepID=UPI001059FA89|nr:DinB family protein [Jeotgalibacillus sp. S-D1]TDL31267.1 DinB family protein [Jeotgalibacillus sp. S-D1]